MTPCGELLVQVGLVLSARLVGLRSYAILQLFQQLAGLIQLKVRVGMLIGGDRCRPRVSRRREASRPACLLKASTRGLCG